jgi:predicted outer membrane repeat protein
MSIQAQVFTPHRLHVWIVVAWLFASVFAAYNAAPANAQTTITVTTLSDVVTNDGQCSLPEALQAAMQNIIVDSCAAGDTGTDVIDLSTLSGDLELVTPLPDVTADIVLQGPGADTLRIIRIGESAFRLFTVRNATVSLADVTLQGGAAASGAGIYNQGGDVSLQRVILTENNASSSGGALYNDDGVLRVQNSRLSANSAGSSGGAIFSSGTPPEPTTELVLAAEFELDRVLQMTSDLQISDTHITNNVAGSSGGGIYMQDGVLSLLRSTLSANAATASGGGLLNDGAEVTLGNVTLSGNRAASIGGGMHNRVGLARLNNVTVAVNAAGRGAGLANDSIMRLGNSIISGNNGGVCTGIITSTGANLLGTPDVTCTLEQQDAAQPADLVGQTAVLAPLQTNDSANDVPSHAIDAFSPAYNAGDDATCESDDSRGVLRPQGDACDIGAYEALIIEPFVQVNQPIETSPINGEDNVAPTRETILRFAKPLDATTVTLDNLVTTVRGQTLLPRINLSPDQRVLTLFYNGAGLPDSSTVSLTLQNLRHADNTLVDLDQDGIGGGVLTLSYTTGGITVIPNTRVCGRVFASELDENGSELASNRPLQGVRISVDGREAELFTVTDFAGNYCLDPAPVGKFFVHIEGNTALNPVPDGAYYPSVGKMWAGIPGETVTKPDTFLPLVPTGTLQPVSATEETVIQMSPAAQAAHPELAGITLRVPANSLYADDGTRGGSVGIAPVNPDRLPGPLPDGLNHLFDITVQSDGPTNFDVPAPICFPNLGDARTGGPLAPGDKTALTSFDHDVGSWTIVGSMTVTADGAQVCTDPGVGIVAPGWHAPSGSSAAEGPVPSTGANGGSEPNAGSSSNPRYPKNPQADECKNPWGDISLRSLISEMLGCANNFFSMLPAVKSLINAAIEINTIYNELQKIYADVQSGRRSAADLRAVVNTLRRSSSVAKQTIDALNRTANPINKLSAIADCLNRGTRLLDPVCNGYNDQGSQCFGFWEGLLMKGYCSVGHPLVRAATEGISRTLKALSNGIANLAFTAIDNLCDAILKSLDQTGSGSQALSSAQQDELDALMQQLYAELDGLLVPAGDLPDEAALENAVMDYLAVLGNLDYIAQGYYPNAYVLLRYGGGQQRTRLSASGNLRRAILPPDVLYDVLIFDPVSNQCGTGVNMAGPSGSGATFAPPPMSACDPLDMDMDQLSDQAEDIIGTDPGRADSDNDGINDGPEVYQNSDPLDGALLPLNVTNVAPLPGEPLDICISDDVAVVSYNTNGVSGGVALYNVFINENPVLIANIPTPGQVNRLACAGNFAAGAAGNAGLMLIDFSNPLNVDATYGLGLGAGVLSVAVDDGQVLVGMNNGALVLLSAADAVELSRVSLGFAVMQDVAFVGDLIYVLDGSTLRTFNRLPDEIGTQVNQLNLGGFYQRMLLGNGFGVVHNSNAGVVALDLSNPLTPVIHYTDNNGPFNGLRRHLPNGTGLTLGVDADELIVFDETTIGAGLPAPLRTFVLPGTASGMGLSRGIAYIPLANASSAPGQPQHQLAVVNYLDFDRAGNAPQVTLDTNISGSSVTESERLRLSALVQDDVQVRQVEFFLDAERVAVDTSFPFEYRYLAPVAGSNQTASIVVSDTGGNTTTSAPISYSSGADTSPPTVNIIAPAPNDTRYGNGAVGVLVDVTDNIGVAALTFSINGQVVPSQRVGLGRYVVESAFVQGQTYDLSLNVRDVSGNQTDSSVVPFTFEPLVDGGRIMGTLQGDVLPFSANAGDVVYRQGAGELRTPSGLRIIESRRLELAETGIYSLIVENFFQSYSAEISSVSDENLNISIGDSISENMPAAGAGRIAMLGQHDTYTFDAIAGDAIYLDVRDDPLPDVSSAGNLSVDMDFFDPAGNLIDTLTLGTVPFASTTITGRYNLAQTGRYTLLVRPVAGSSADFVGTYSFDVRAVTQDDSFNISVGDEIGPDAPQVGMGKLEEPGATDSYTFTLTQETEIFVDGIDGSEGSLWWTLENSAGGLIHQQTLFPASGDVYDFGRWSLPAETYTLKVGRAGYAQLEATYRFKLWSLVDQTFNINLGDTVSPGVPDAQAGTIDVPGEIHSYLFSVSEATTAFLDVLTDSRVQSTGGLNFWLKLEIVRLSDGAAIIPQFSMTGNPVGSIDFAPGSYAVNVFSRANEDIRTDFSFSLTPDAQ